MSILYFAAIWLTGAAIGRVLGMHPYINTSNLPKDGLLMASLLAWPILILATLFVGARYILGIPQPEPSKMIKAWKLVLGICWQLGVIIGLWTLVS